MVSYKVQSLSKHDSLLSVHATENNRYTELDSIWLLIQKLSQGNYLQHNHWQLLLQVSYKKQLGSNGSESFL
jgi:hypothetical protein